MIRGAIYRIDLGAARGHEQRGRRLGLVMSPSRSPLSVITVVPVSTSAGRSIHRPEVEIAGLGAVFLVDQIRSIDADFVIGEPVAFLTREQLTVIELAVAHYLGVQEFLSS